MATTINVRLFYIKNHKFSSKVSDQNKLYTKIVEFKEIYNFVVNTFLILDGLYVQMFNINSHIRFEMVRNVEWRQSQHQSYIT